MNLSTEKKLIYESNQLRHGFNCYDRKPDTIHIFSGNRCTGFQPVHTVWFASQLLVQRNQGCWFKLFSNYEHPYLAAKPINSLIFIFHTGKNFIHSKRCWVIDIGNWFFTSWFQEWFPPLVDFESISSTLIECSYCSHKNIYSCDCFWVEILIQLLGYKSQFGIVNDSLLYMLIMIIVIL